MMQKKIFLTLGALLFVSTSHAQEKRTDGPPGTEYGDFSDWDGRSQVGFHVGAMIDSNTDKTGISLGLDFDYRPSDLFGIRATFEQGIQKAKHSFFFLTPLIHNNYSNLQWYFSFGPGLGLMDLSSRQAKFLFALGLGGDFMFNEKIGLGMYWSYSFLLGGLDVNHVGARFCYQF